MPLSNGTRHIRRNTIRSTNRSFPSLAINLYIAIHFNTHSVALRMEKFTKWRDLSTGIHPFIQKNTFTSTPLLSSILWFPLRLIRSCCLLSSLFFIHFILAPIINLVIKCRTSNNQKTQKTSPSIPLWILKAELALCNALLVAIGYHLSSIQRTARRFRLEQPLVIESGDILLCNHISFVDFYILTSVIGCCSDNSSSTKHDTSKRDPKERDTSNPSSNKQSSSIQSSSMQDIAMQSNSLQSNDKCSVHPVLPLFAVIVPSNDPEANKSSGSYQVHVSSPNAFWSNGLTNSNGTVGLAGLLDSNGILLAKQAFPHHFNSISDAKQWASSMGRCLVIFPEECTSNGQGFLRFFPSLTASTDLSKTASHSTKNSATDSHASNNNQLNSQNNNNNNHANSQTTNNRNHNNNHINNHCHNNNGSSSHLLSRINSMDDSLESLPLHLNNSSSTYTSTLQDKLANDLLSENAKLCCIKYSSSGNTSMDAYIHGNKWSHLWSLMGRLYGSWSVQLVPAASVLSSRDYSSMYGITTNHGQSDDTVKSSNGHQMEKSISNGSVKELEQAFSLMSKLHRLSLGVHKKQTFLLEYQTKAVTKHCKVE